MRKATTSWARLVLALAAVLVVAGPSLVLAGGFDPSYVPQSSVIIGDSSVTLGQPASTPYVLRVTFTNGAVADFMPSPGATFSAGVGAIDSTTGAYTAPASGSVDRITGKLTQNSVTTTASRFIHLTP